MTVAVRVIPCLDVDAGRVVKGVNFVDLRDAGDPVEMARTYDAEGADELVFLDITASSGDRETTYDVVRRTAEQVFIPLTVGGGVRTVDDVDRLLRAGADKVGVNTAAVARPELVAEVADRFGAQVLVLSIDARRTLPGEPTTESGFEVTTHGGRRGTGIDAVAVGAARRDGRSRRDPAQLDGRRRDQGRLRPGDDQCRARGRDRPGRSPPAAPAGSRTSPPPSRPAPTPCSPRASSTSAMLRIGAVKDALSAAGHPVRR